MFSFPFRACAEYKRKIKGPSAHPAAHPYPCCLPALGEFCKMTPRGESGASLNEFAKNAKHGEMARLRFHHFLCQRPAVHSLA